MLLVQYYWPHAQRFSPELRDTSDRLFSLAAWCIDSTTCCQRHKQPNNSIIKTRAVLSQRWPRNAPYTWVPCKFSGLLDYVHGYCSQHFSWAFVPIHPINVRGISSLTLIYRTSLNTLKIFITSISGGGGTMGTYPPCPPHGRGT